MSRPNHLSAQTDIVADMHIFKVADATITITHEDRTGEGRQRYRYTIATPSFEFTGNDLSSGVGDAPDETSMAPSVLSFLSACAESRSHNNGDGDNAALFPEHMGEWAEQHSDELAILGSNHEH